MNKGEFAAIVDELLAKLYAIGINDYQAGLNVVSGFKRLASVYREHLPSDITGGVAEIEDLFGKAGKYRNTPKQYEHFRIAELLLEGAITKLKQTNQFPE